MLNALTIFLTAGLDGRVAKTVFERVFINNLKRDGTKTVLLVTHQMQFLKNCDEILVFADGSIAERGTHE
jgi:ABC-type multidrug transport system fused ATPase/permease subunit